jgi:hypothetical protein
MTVLPTSQQEWPDMRWAVRLGQFSRTRSGVV